MLINHTRRFVFVHIHKTAGSSMFSVLSSMPRTMPHGHAHTFIKDGDVAEYSNYFKFAVVRNPWARAVSWYHSLLHLTGPSSFSNYVRANCNDFSGFLDCTATILDKTLDLPRRPENALLTKNPDLPYPKSLSFNQLDYICDENQKLAVDYVGRFEQLDEAWTYICQQIGISRQLPHKNSSGPRSKGQTYREHYKSDADVEKIRKLYARDIAHFGYEF